MSIRKSAVAGVFYPQSCSEMENYIAHFNNQMPKISINEPPKALIVPHAGYIYSGYTANMAYYLASKRHDIKSIVVIGPSHRVYLKGASIGLFDTYPTPCGMLQIEHDLCQQLQKKHAFLGFTPSAHEEHSTEVQMPFIKYYFPEVKVVEIVYGDITYLELSSLIDGVLQDEHTLVVISTDLSHFHTQEQANTIDALCVNAITHLDVDGLEGCEACGLMGVKAMVQSAKNMGLKPHFLDYRTSYERSKDASSVVGYTSFIMS